RGAAPGQRQVRAALPRDGVACRFARAGLRRLGSGGTGSAVARGQAPAGGWRTRGLLALPRKAGAPAAAGGQARKISQAATIISAKPARWFHLIGSPMTQTEKPMKTVRVMTSWI